MRRGRFVVGSACMVVMMTVAATASAATVPPLPRRGGIKVIGLLLAETLAPLVSWGLLGRLRA